MHNNLRNIKLKPKPGSVSEFGWTEEKDKRAKITSAETPPGLIQCHLQSLDTRRTDVLKIHSAGGQN